MFLLYDTFKSLGLSNEQIMKMVVFFFFCMTFEPRPLTYDTSHLMPGHLFTHQVWQLFQLTLQEKVTPFSTFCQCDFVTFWFNDFSTCSHCIVSFTCMKFSYMLILHSTPPFHHLIGNTNPPQLCTVEDPLSDKTY